jgi:hypothetical protein
MTDELTRAEPGREMAKIRKQLRGYSDVLRLLLYFDGDRRRLIVDRFFSEWDALRDLLPPSLGQVGISLKTAELTLHGGAKDAIERRLSEARHQSLFREAV